MSGKFKWKKFSDVNINDPFFDSLKADYPEFPGWFIKKQIDKEPALVYEDENGIGAFIYLKKEMQDIKLADKILIPKERIKIGTLKLSERIRSQRLGEGAIGVALWYWRWSKRDEVYLTVFDKHSELIKLLDRFGFEYVGKNPRGESVFVKNKNHLDFSDSYKCFPFINGKFDTAGIIPIEDEYHDQLFPYSELARNNVDIDEITAGNGITKIFIATPFSNMVFKENMPVFLYRKYNGKDSKTYKSVITSFSTITKIHIVKDNGVKKISFDDFIELSGNKTVYSEEYLKYLYDQKQNIVALELVYNGYFGKGHNVTHHKLKENGLFENHPYKITYTKEEFKKILEMGDINVQNTIIN